jgi:hypothetical protein
MEGDSSWKKKQASRQTAEQSSQLNNSLNNPARCATKYYGQDNYNRRKYS